MTRGTADSAGAFLIQRKIKPKHGNVTTQDRSTHSYVYTTQVARQKLLQNYN